VAADQLQESLKANLWTATIALDKADRQMYLLASGGIDAAAGAYGKTRARRAPCAGSGAKLHRPTPVPNPET
jgi:hypothetical protein